MSKSTFVTTAGPPAESCQLQRETAKEAQARLAAVASEMFEQSIARLLDHNAIADYITTSRGDGQGGALKVKAIHSADSKTVTYNVLNPDGTFSPTALTYEDTPAGVASVKVWLCRSTPLQQKIIDLHQQDELRRRTEKCNADASFGGQGIKEARARRGASHRHLQASSARPRVLRGRPTPTRRLD